MIQRIDRGDRHGWRVCVRTLPLFVTRYDAAQDQYQKGWWFWSPAVFGYRRGWEKSTNGLDVEFQWGMIPHSSARPFSVTQNAYYDDFEAHS